MKQGRELQADRPRGVRNLLSKVPEVTVLFWTIKVLTTGMGEAASDFLAHTLGPVAAVAFGVLGLVVSLLWQFQQDQYRPGVYWTAVMMVSVFGTLAADAVHVALGIPYLVSALFFLVSLFITFWLWHRIEGTLSIHSIHTRRREVFYWVVVLCTFALGTAVGDLTAKTFHWGWLTSGVIFGVLFILPLMFQRLFRGQEILVFWVSYIFTRPYGASFADFMWVPVSQGGLGWGAGTVTLLLTGVIVLLVVVLALGRKEVRDA
ncbi:COG4705 family protein [Deinococcus roseus]|uniref:Membrane protein n=1 Tax=Deinococcus roseus TaxID=392414 RepID=A0ABQ2DGV1_9DEIO|nr:hypothetical protein [Deinococcus roseus]GGJ57565.1 membrane protein [Deinococcus roseus]